MSHKNAPKSIWEKLRPCRFWLYLFAVMMLVALVVRSSTMKPSIFRVILLALRSLALGAAPDFFAELGVWYEEARLAPLIVNLVYLSPLVGFAISAAWALGFRIKPSITFPKEDDSTPPPIFPQPDPAPKEQASPIDQWAQAQYQRALSAHGYLTDIVRSCRSPYRFAYNNPGDDNAPVVRLQDFSTSPKDEILTWNEEGQCVVTVGQLELLLDYTTDSYECVPRIHGVTYEGDALVDTIHWLEPDKPLVILRQEGTEPHVRCALTWIGG